MAGLKFSCGACGQHLEVDDDLAGMEVNCPTCGAHLRIPKPDALPGPDGLPVAPQLLRGVVERTPAAVQESGASGQAAEAAVQRGGRRVWLPLVGGLIVLVLAFVGAAYWYFVLRPQGDLALPSPGIQGTVASQSATTGIRTVALDELYESSGRNIWALLPADGEQFFLIRPAEIWTSPVLQQLSSLNPEFFEGLAVNMQTELGFRPEDIEELAVAMRETESLNAMLKEAQQQTPFQTADRARLPAETLKVSLAPTSPVFGIVRVNKSLSEDEFQKLLALAPSRRVSQLGDLTVHLLSDQTGGSTLAVHLVGSDLVAFGSEGEVKRVLTGEGRLGVPPPFVMDAVGGDSQILMLGLGVNRGGTNQTAQVYTNELDRLMNEAVSLYALGIRFDKTISAKMALVCDQQEDAIRLGELLASEIQNLGKQLVQLRMLLPPLASDLIMETYKSTKLRMAHLEKEAVVIEVALPERLFERQTLQELVRQFSGRRVQQ